MPDPNFHLKQRQTSFLEIRLIVESIINDKVSTWFDQNPSVTKRFEKYQAAIAEMYSKLEIMLEERQTLRVAGKTCGLSNTKREEQSFL